jgi:Zn-dependent protease
MKTTTGLKIASIHGIDLKIHISLLFLLAYLVLVTVLRFQVITQAAKIDMAELSFGPLPWGFLLATALFLSVVIHEFTHALVAQALGVPVRGIVLMMLGGISLMDRMPEGKYAEFKLAVVGPLASMALAVILFFLHAHTTSTDILFFSYWLGSVNLALAVFNLLPAFPLDGGRALRSLLSVRRGTLHATQVAVRVSKAFAWAFGIIGLLDFNFLLILIAFFIYTAAQSELFVLLSRSALRGLRVGDVMTLAPPIHERAPLAEAAHQMWSTKKTVLPVNTASGLPNLVSLSRLMRVHRDFWQGTLVKDLMEESPKILDVNGTIGDFLTDLAGAPFETLPVQEDGKIIGIVQYSAVAEILQLKSLEEVAESSTKFDRAA